MITKAENQIVGNVIKELESFGLTDKEARVYIAATKFQTFSMADVARASQVKRPTCYIIVESLIKKGFVVAVPDAKLSRYIVIEPSVLLEKKKEQIKTLEVAVTQLNSIRYLSSVEQPTIKLYRGKSGVKEIYLEILNDKPKFIASIANPDYLATYLGSDFLTWWGDRRSAAGIYQYALQNKDYEKNNPRPKGPLRKREVRYLPEDFDTSSMFYLWNHKVGFISNKIEGISFIVSSKEFSELQKRIFDDLWNKYNA